MAPSLALALCSLFVLWLLSLDRRDAQGVSSSLWLPTVWMLYCASRPLGAWFGSESSGSAASVEEGSAIDRLFLSGLIAGGFFVLGKRRFDWGRAFREQRWLIALYGFMALSCIWSDNPYISFKRWVKVAGSLLMAFVVMSEQSPIKAMEAILRRSAYVLLPFSLLLIKYFDQMGRQYDRWDGTVMWVGVSTQKNGLGVLTLVCALSLVWTFVRRWRHGELGSSRVGSLADGLVLFIALWLIKGPGTSYSATAASSLVMGTCVILGLTWLDHRGRLSNVKWLKLAPLVGVSVGIAIPLAGGGDLLSQVLSLLGRDPTFTGRTDIWRLILPIAWSHPLVGCGYGSFWVDPPLPAPFNLLTHSHNGYVEVFLELGCVGVMLVVGSVLNLFGRAQEALVHNAEVAGFAISILTILLFHNITESSFARASSFLWSVALLFAALLPRLCEDRVAEFGGALATSTEAQVDAAEPPAAGQTAVPRGQTI